MRDFGRRRSRSGRTGRRPRSIGWSRTDVLGDAAEPRVDVGGDRVPLAARGTRSRAGGRPHPGRPPGMRERAGWLGAADLRPPSPGRTGPDALGRCARRLCQPRIGDCRQAAQRDPRRRVAHVLELVDQAGRQILDAGEVEAAGLVGPEGEEARDPPLDVDRLRRRRRSTRPSASAASTAGSRRNSLQAGSDASIARRRDRGPLPLPGRRGRIPLSTTRRLLMKGVSRRAREIRPPSRAGYDRRMPDRLHFTESDEANELIATDPMALLVGFALDQQVTVQKAFSGPLVLRERLGSLDAGDARVSRPRAGLPREAGDPPLPRVDGRASARPGRPHPRQLRRRRRARLDRRGRRRRAAREPRRRCRASAR